MPDYRTELSYINQHLKTNMPQYKVEEVGRQFVAKASIDFPAESVGEFRKSRYEARSDPQKNSDLAKSEAAKRLLLAMYRDNPDKWREFVKIKERKNLKY